MADINALREELYTALSECLEVMGKSRTYEEVRARYMETKKRADARLAEMDALCLDSERYIDKATGRLRAGIGIEPDEELLAMLTELGGLAATLELFARDERWQDDLMNNISGVLSIAGYEAVEKKITDELGLFRGRQLILEVKRAILPLDAELGLYFFTDQVESLDGLIRTMTLFAKDAMLELDRPDNLDAAEVNLRNLFGEYLRYRTSSKITLGGECYVELELLEDMRARTFSYYLAESNGQGYRLTLVEDRAREGELDRARERLCARFGC